MNNFERLVDEQRIWGEVKACVNAFSSVTASHVSYASSAITTGIRLYRQFEEYGVTSKEELQAVAPNVYTNQVIKPNTTDGIVFGKQVQQRTGGAVIIPVTFYRPNWDQVHYM